MLAYAESTSPDTLLGFGVVDGAVIECVNLIRGILAELREQGKTIVLVSHNAEDIRVLCDKIYEMDKGRIVYN